MAKKTEKKNPQAEALKGAIEAKRRELHQYELAGHQDKLKTAEEELAQLQGLLRGIK